MNNIEKAEKIKTKEELKKLLDTDKSFKEEFLRDYLGNEVFTQILNSGIELEDIGINIGE